MKLVALGDSLTYGFGVYKNQSFIELAKTSLDIEIINKGINGETTTGMLTRSYEDVIKLNPNYVLFMGGTNDLFKNTPLNNIINNILELVKEAKSYNITPIIGIPIPVNISMAKDMWSPYIDYNQVNIALCHYEKFVVKYCSENNLLHINFYRDFINNSINDNINNLYIDGVHPSPLGHIIMSNSFTRCIGEQR